MEWNRIEWDGMGSYVSIIPNSKVLYSYPTGINLHQSVME